MILAALSAVGGFFAPHQFFITGICLVLLFADRKQSINETTKCYGKEK